MTCLIETQTDLQPSVAMESDEQLLGCEEKSEARIFLLTINM